MDLTIRPARPDEYPRLGELVADAYLREGLLDYGEEDPYLPVLRDVARRAEVAEVWVATTPDPAATPPGTVTVLPDPAAVPPDTAAVPPDTAATPPGTVTATPDPAATPPDTVTVLPDPAATPPDTAAVPPDTAATPPGTVTATPDPAATPPDTVTVLPDPAATPPDPAATPPGTVAAADPAAPRAAATPDAVLGTVTFVPSGGNPMADIARPDEAEIRMLAVAPEARGQGVGEALVRACVARAAGAERVVLSTQSAMHAAHRLYERLGFVRSPHRDWNPVPELDDLTLLTYELTL